MKVLILSLGLYRFVDIIICDQSAIVMLSIYDFLLLKRLRFMRGRHPQTILTDIDSSLRDAMEREFPNTKHVICSWHVLSKLSSWFSLPFGSQYEEFKAEFDMFCQLEGIEEFEHQWNLLVARFGLASDKHIALLFSYTTFWPLSYIRGYFLACSMTA